MKGEELSGAHALFCYVNVISTLNSSLILHVQADDGPAFIRTYKQGRCWDLNVLCVPQPLDQKSVFRGLDWLSCQMIDRF